MVAVAAADAIGATAAEAAALGAAAATLAVGCGAAVVAVGAGSDATGAATLAAGAVWVTSACAGCPPRVRAIKATMRTTAINAMPPAIGSSGIRLGVAGVGGW